MVTKTQLRTVENTTAATDPQSTADPQYKVQFATPIVKPTGLPGFMYVGTAWSFDCVVYTALLTAPSALEAMNSVKRHWQEATIIYVQQGAEGFTFADKTIRPVSYGFEVNQPTKLGRLRSIFI